MPAVQEQEQPFVKKHIEEPSELTRLDKAREELDHKKRLPMIRKIDELIAADAPYAFLFAPKYVLYAHNTRIKKPKEKKVEVKVDEVKEEPQAS